jgi:hypothetical protein
MALLCILHCKAVRLKLVLRLELENKDSITEPPQQFLIAPVPV